MSSVSKRFFAAFAFAALALAAAAPAGATGMLDDNNGMLVAKGTFNGGTFVENNGSGASSSGLLLELTRTRGVTFDGHPESQRTDRIRVTGTQTNFGDAECTGNCSSFAGALGSGRLNIRMSAPRPQR